MLDKWRFSCCKWWFICWITGQNRWELQERI